MRFEMDDGTMANGVGVRSHTTNRVYGSRLGLPTELLIAKVLHGAAVARNYNRYSTSWSLPAMHG